MSDPSQLPDSELFSRYVDGERDKPFDDTFQERLADRDFADRFMLFLQDHVTLRNLFRVSAIQSQVGDEAIALAEERGRGPRSILGRGFGTHLLAAATAATLAVVLFSMNDLDLEEAVADRDHAEAVSMAVGQSRDLVATLSGVVDCVWTENGSARPYASRLATEEVLQLSEGVAQVTFDSGAKVVLEGPCNFRVVDAMSSVLDHGRLSAVAPDSASGFEVLTPSSRVIDIGTEFGVAVGREGASAIHVFKGEVVTSSLLASSGNPEPLSLKTDEGVEYGLHNKAANRITADSSAFKMGVGARLHKDQLPTTPVTDGLAMWLRADTGIVLDLNNRVTAWQDVLIGDNVSADDAMQPADYARPALRAQGLNGRPSVRFDGRATFLMTPPMASTSSQTIVVVASFSRDSTGSGQLLSYEGPPKRILTDPTEYGFIEINAYGNETPLFYPVLYAGFDGPHPVNYGGVKNSNPLDYDRPYIFAYRYDYAANSAELFIDGHLNGTASAEVSAAVTSRRVIGKHGNDGNFYAGDMAELLIWDRAVTDVELDSIVRHLTTRYISP